MFWELLNWPTSTSSSESSHLAKAARLPLDRSDGILPTWFPQIDSVIGKVVQMVGAIGDGDSGIARFVGQIGGKDRLAGRSPPRPFSGRNIGRRRYGRRPCHLAKGDRRSSRRGRSRGFEVAVMILLIVL